MTSTGFLNPSSSAAPGDTVTLYVTGVGQVRPAVRDGEAPTNANTKPAQAVSLTVGGATAVTSYVGVPTWSVSVLQINFVIPATAAPGKQPVVVTVGGASSQTAYIDIT
jgi:uncharacterized protein (TIGR03437 family)